MSWEPNAVGRLSSFSDKNNPRPFERSDDFVDILDRYVSTLFETGNCSKAHTGQFGELRLTKAR
ncbi:UNVERIFIED_ORG: hypothetical protein GGD43_004456 [Rhizobium esperanzae]